MKTIIFISAVQILTLIFCQSLAGKSTKVVGKQRWGYFEVRPRAFMFYWLYYTTGTKDYTQKPWVIWLQGGPGGSSTGFGNFKEIGPLDASLRNRKYSWVSKTNILFIDNPVGSGFSYVNDPELLTTNNTQIATDLIQMITKFLGTFPTFQAIPLHIFGESYGGKMAAPFALELYKQIKQGRLKCNLKSLNLVDSWISPVDSVLSYANFLFSTSMIDSVGFTAINDSAYKVKAAMDKKQWLMANNLWNDTMDLIDNRTNRVNIYNILLINTDAYESELKAGKFKQVDTSLFVVPFTGRELTPVRNRKIGGKHLTQLDSDSDALADLMNGPIRKMLRIIPKNVNWEMKNSEVAQKLDADFMKPVVQIVEKLMNETNVAVNLCSGHLDLIVNSIGTMKWVEKMNWIGITGWKNAPNKPMSLNNQTAMFVKSFKKLGLYSILRSGHMVPEDQPETALWMLQLITNPTK